MRKNRVLFIAVIAAVLNMCGLVQAAEVVAYEFTYPGDINDVNKPTRINQGKRI